MSDNFEEYKAYKIKRSLAITESTVELMDVMTRMIKMLNKANISYELNIDKFNDDSVQIGYYWGSFEIKINKFPLIIEIAKDCDYGIWKYVVIDGDEKYFDTLTTIFENKKKMIKCFIKTIWENL